MGLCTALATVVLSVTIHCRMIRTFLLAKVSVFNSELKFSIVFSKNACFFKCLQLMSSSISFYFITHFSLSYLYSLCGNTAPGAHTDYRSHRHFGMESFVYQIVFYIYIYIFKFLRSRLRAQVPPLCGTSSCS